MQLKYSGAGATQDGTSGQTPRRHPRSTVLKAATIHPVIREAGLLVGNVSHSGIMGRCALPLSLGQSVHVTFDQREFLPAEIRWVQGDRYGLQLADRRFDVPDGSWAMPEAIEGMRQRAPRIAADMAATLLTTLPMLPGLVRNLSRGGMLIEVGMRLREGERLLVKMRDQPTLIGRIQWSRLGCAGLEFAHELPIETVADGAPPTSRAGDGPSDGHEQD